jgi:hypothetical protein
MTREEIQKLVQLRDFAMKFYQNLGPTWKTSSASVIATKDAGHFTESMVRSIEDILRPHVKFE